MIKYNNTNNASTTLTAGISPSSTTIIVENGDILPTAPFLLTLEHFDNEKVTVREIVKCIAKAGNILTIQRGAGTCVQDDSASTKEQGNSAHSFSVGDCASIYWTSEQVQDIQNEIEKKLNIDDFQAGTYVYGATSTGTDAYSITIPGTLTSYSVGQVFRFMADVDNEGNATLNINGLGAVEIRKNHDKILDNGDIEAGQIVEVAYDGTYFQMDSQVATVVDLGNIGNTISISEQVAGEVLQEGDVVYNNAGRYDPQFATEDFSIGGSDNNKIAICFTATGEDSTRFKIKAALDENHIPDSITVNLETDDNGKPSGTVLQTADIKNYIKIPNNDFTKCVNSKSRSERAKLTTWEDYPHEGVMVGLTDVYGYGYGQMYRTISGNDYILTINTTDGKKTMVFSGMSGYTLTNNTLNGTFFVFVEGTGERTGNVNVVGFHCPTPFSTEGMTSTSGTMPGYLSVIDETHIGGVPGKRSGSDEWGKVSIFTLDNPYDVSSYTEKILRQNTMCTNTSRKVLGFVYNGVSYFYCYWTQSYNSEVHRVLYSYTDINNVISSNVDWYNVDYVWLADTPHITFTTTGQSYFYLGELDYVLNNTKEVLVPFSLTWLTKGNKYRLTISPTISGSVVDSFKIAYTEGEYNNKTMIRDLNNWRNVPNSEIFIKSPAIDGKFVRKYDGSTNKKIFMNKIYCDVFNTPSIINQGYKTMSNVSVNKKYYDNGKYIGYGIDEDTLLFEPNNGISDEIQTFSLSTTDSSKYYTYYNSSVKYSEETTKQAGYLSYSIKGNGTNSTRLLINGKVVKSETTTTAQTGDLYIPSSTTVTIECVAGEGTATFNGIGVI